MTRLADAIRIANECHEGQLDKAGLPYILHPLRVMERVRQKLQNLGRPYDEDLLIAAVLHDTVEDTPITFERIGWEFGPRVEKIVRNVSRVVEPEKELYDTLIERCAADPDSALVKDSDLDDNLSRIAQLPAHEQGIARRYHRAKVKLAGKF